ncbi:MAG: hypothetical protein JWM04_1064 [Verrucomicrobiales bacterium]|nr:hypothetical protein [Verrucomicrobiales bacterium]
MNKLLIFRIFTLWLTLTTVVTKGLGNETKEKLAEELFNGPVLQLKLEIKGKDLEELQRENRKYVHGTLSEGTNVYAEVAVHMKGAAGSFRGLDQNPGFTVNVDKFDKHQTFHGLSKFNLNNSVQDPTYLTDLICSELFRKAGVPASRIGYVQLKFNGRNLGLYLIVEGFNKDFFRKNFGSDSGNFYDGGFLKDITETLDKTSGENPKDQSDLKALAAAANERDLNKRKAGLEKLLDIDRFISFVAMDIICWDWDGYPIKKNNYRIYHDPTTDKMTFIPHGMDQMFWEVNAPIMPGMEGLVARSVLEVPEFRDRYYARMGEIMTNIYDAAALSNRVDGITSKIVPVIKTFNQGQARNVQNAANELKGKLAMRAANIKQQLVSRPKPVKFDANGELVLGGWGPRVEAGQPVMKETTQGDGSAGYLLKIVDKGMCISSWRLKLRLPPGHYEFQATGVSSNLLANPDDKSDGFGIRISGLNKQRGSSSSGSVQLKKFAYPFDVNDQEVELICEMRASRGETFFRKDGLKLVRK